jgi:hypothetical protein
MKLRIMMGTVLLLTIGCVVQAQEGELHGSVDLTYLSKYVWRGFDVYGDKSAVQPSLDLNLFDTGLGVNVTGHRANASGYEALGERWDYTLYYQNALYQDEAYATMYRLGWVYYNYPDMSQEDADLQEIHTILSWPKLCSAGVVPSYVLVKLWPSSSNSLVGAPNRNGTASGFAHIFMLDYALTTAGLLPDTPEQVLNLHSEIVFNDGVGPGGQNVDHDWSNAVFGVSTNFDLAENVTLTPGVYHQITMDSSVNDDKDETWLGLSMTCKF